MFFQYQTITMARTSMSMSGTKEGQTKHLWGDIGTGLRKTLVTLLFIWTYLKCTIQNIPFLQRQCPHPGLNLNVILGTSYKVQQGCYPVFCWSITSIPETSRGKVISYLWSTPGCDAELISHVYCGLTLTGNSASHSCLLTSLRVAWGRELEE